MAEKNRLGHPPPVRTQQRLRRCAFFGNRTLQRASDWGEQLVPTFEVVPFGQPVEGEKEALGRPAPVAGLIPQDAQLVADAMECKCDQVQRQQGVGPALLAMTEMVFHAAALIFEQIERLVINLPAGAPAGHDFGDLVLLRRQSSHEAKGGALVVAPDITNAKLHIVDLQRVFAGRQRQRMVAPKITVLLV